jgi:hypothetical protein
LERFVLRHVPGVNTWLVLRVRDRAATEVSA